MSISVSVKRKLETFELDVHFSSHEKIVGLLGASGAGKSMLLKTIAGLFEPESGKIVVDDVVYFDSSAGISLQPRQRKAGVVFQHYALFPHMTVAENIAFSLEPKKSKESMDKVDRLLRDFHLEALKDYRPSKLSGGQQQRVALARALAMEPKVLLLDEPFSALDIHLKAQLIKEMKNALSDYSGHVVYVTHNMEEAFQLCGHVVVLDKGHMISSGLKEEIFLKPCNMQTARIIGMKNLASAKLVGPNLLMVPEWGIMLQYNEDVIATEGFVGIHAYHIKLNENCLSENMFECTIVDLVINPNYHTLYLKFAGEPESIDDYHIQMDVPAEDAMQIENKKTVKICIPEEYIYYS